MASFGVKIAFHQHFYGGFSASIRIISAHFKASKERLEGNHGRAISRGGHRISC